MALAPATNIEKAAVLLRRLPAPSLTRVLEMIGVEYSTRLQTVLTAVAKRPDLQELDEQVLQEFREMQAEIRESLRGSPVLEQALAGQFTDPSAKPLTPKRTAAGGTSTNDWDQGDEDPITVLPRIPPAVLAAAMRQETPRSIALILKELPTEFTGKVLEQFPTEQRQQIFMLLAVKTTVQPVVIRKLMTAIIGVCKTIDLNAVEEQDGRFKTLITILQMVQREERLRLMEALTEQDQELAAQIDDSLYDYADLLRIQDRSVQKLMTQLELKVVALALKTATEDIVEKVMKNLSERVRATLLEEMEYLTNVNAAKVDEARKEIANVIRQQDKDGTLQWIEAA